MSEGNTETLTCAICKQSCEGKPHATDAKGRVICRSCIDKKKAARTATDTGGQDVMGALLSKSKMSNATPCPSCKSYMPAETVICTHCGYNTQTGKAATTRVIAAPKEKKAKKAGGGMSLSFDPMMGIWILTAIYALLAIGCFTMPDILAVFMIVAIVHAVLVSIVLLVVMVIDGDILWLFLSLVPMIGGFVMLYYILAKMDRPAVRAHWILSVVATIVAVLLFTSFGPTEDGVAAGPNAFPTQGLPA